MSSKTPAECIRGMGPEVSKADIRKAVWDYLEANDLANFPRPVHNRIPNFKGCIQASDKVAAMDEFKHARTVKVNPDKPQEQARFLTLEADKNLLVPTPRLRSGLFNKIVPPTDGGKNILRTCASSQGVRHYSMSIGLNEKVHIDLIIIGSVAVSEKGYRIGKGEGYADLEFGMMVAMGAVDENTVIISTVHECQIVDIPDELIEEHDVVVDYIVTADNIIKCHTTKPRPTGIYWSKLTRARLQRMPVLKKLRAIERNAGKDVTLMDSPEDGPDHDGNDSAEDLSSNESDGDNDHRSGGQRRRGNIGHFVVFIGSLPRSLRVREFKDKVREKDVNPIGVIWRGGAGHAFLRFEEVEQAESAVDILNDFEINGKKLRVEMGQNRRRSMRRNRNNSGVQSSEDGDRNSSAEQTDDTRDRRGGRNEDRRDNRRRMDSSSQRRRPVPRRGRYSREPGVFVGRLPRFLRVSEFKEKIREKEVYPVTVIWRGMEGHAFLYFEDAESTDHAIDVLGTIDIDGKRLRVEHERRRPRDRRSKLDSENQSDESESGEGLHNGEKSDENSPVQGERGERRNGRRQGYLTGKPAVFVGSIPRSLRISEFKSEIRGKDVNPLAVIWRGGRQFAFLVFDDLEQAETAVSILNEIELSGRKLRVELSKQSQDKSD